MKDNRYSMLHDFAVDVRPVKIRHFTVGWPIAVRWGPKQLEVRTRKPTCPVFYIRRPPLPPRPVYHSSWAVLLSNEHSKPACYSSGRNSYAKLSNTPLNQRQSRLVLHHIFFSPSAPDLISLSWPPFTPLWKEMQIFLRLNGRGEPFAVCRATPPPPLSVPADSSMLVGHSRSLSGSSGIARRLYSSWPSPQVTLLFLRSTDLWANKHSLSCLSLWFPLQPCGWKGTAFPKGILTALLRHST